MKRLYALLLLVPGAFNVNAQSVNLSLNSGYVVNYLLSESGGYKERLSTTESMVSFSAIAYTRSAFHFGINANISRLTNMWYFNYNNVTINPNKLEKAEVIFGMPAINISAMGGFDWNTTKSEFMLGAAAGYVMAKTDMTKNQKFFTAQMHEQSSRGISYGLYFRYGYHFFDNLGINAEVRPAMYSLTTQNTGNKLTFFRLPIMLGIHVRI